MRTPPVSVRVCGTGDPVLVLHGLGGNADQSLALLPPHAAATRIAPEMPGHGRTDLIQDEPLTFQVFADHTAHILDTMQRSGRIPAGSIPVVGVSMGAGIATALACSRPDLVSSLTLVRPSWADQSPPPHLKPFIEISRLLSTNPPGPARDRFTRSSTYSDVATASPAMADSLLGQFSRPHAAERARVLHDLPYSLPLGSRTAYGAITVPTLLLGAPGDPVHPDALAQQLAGWIPGAAYAQVPAKQLDATLHTLAVQDRVWQHLTR